MEINKGFQPIAQVLSLDALTKQKDIKPKRTKDIEDTNLKEKRNPNFCIIPSRAIRDQRINKTAAFQVLAAYCQYTNKAGVTWVGQTRIAQDLGVTQQSVSKQVIRLVETGYITIDRTGHTGSNSVVRVIHDESLKSVEEVIAAIPASKRTNVDVVKPETEEEREARKERNRANLAKAREALKRRKLTTSEVVLNDQHNLTTKPTTNTTNIHITAPDHTTSEVVKPTTPEVVPNDSITIYKTFSTTCEKQNANWKHSHSAALARIRTRASAHAPAHPGTPAHTLASWLDATTWEQICESEVGRWARDGIAPSEDLDCFVRYGKATLLEMF